MTIRTEHEVDAFLRQFKPKFDIWGIIFLNRDKNEEALQALGITPKAREKIVKDVGKEDYPHTIEDEIANRDLWVFGKDYDGTQLYIKISMGVPNSKTICILFHEAEFPLNLPYKK